MSANAQAYFLPNTEVAECEALVRRAGLDGSVVALPGDWVRIDLETPSLEPDPRLLAANTGLLLHWVYAQDFGWAFHLYRGPRAVSRYGCDFSECETPEELEFDDRHVDYEQMAALAPAGSARGKFRQELHAILHPDPYSFMDYENPPAFAFLRLLGLPRPLEADPMPGFERIGPEFEGAGQSLPLSPPAEAETVDPQLLGVWDVIQDNRSRLLTIPDVNPEITWEFREDEIECQMLSGARIRDAYWVRTDTVPKEITWEFRWDSRMTKAALREMERCRKQTRSRGVQGIYEVRGDDLRICLIAFHANLRPTQMNSSTEGELITIRFRRAASSATTGEKTVPRNESGF